VAAVLAVVLLAVAVVVMPARPVSAGVPETPVSFTSHGVRLHGSVLAAPGSGRHPAVVIVDGSGPHGRYDHRIEAESFARAGIVTLVYDKRTAGYSMLHRDFSVLADDALAAAAVLRARADVDPARVGLWALSEGTWVAELAAARSPELAFLVLVGASGVPPVRQQSWSTAEALRHDGVSGSMVDTVGLRLPRLAAAAGLFAEAHFDPVPVLRRVHQPVLALWGTLDRSSPPAESSRLISAALHASGAPYQQRFFPGAQHDLHSSPDGYHVTDEQTYTAGYQQLVARWVLDPAADPGRTDLATPPHQQRQSRAVPPLRGWESVPVQLAVVVLMLLGFAGYAVASAVGRIRRVAGRTRMPWSVRVLAWTGPSTVLILPLFLLYASNPDAALGPAPLGRPIPWLVLQLLALTNTVALLHATVVLVRGSARPRRVAPLLVAGALLVPWSLYWGLLLP
jgi:dienelactone hydrolase